MSLRKRKVTSPLRSKSLTQPNRFEEDVFRTGHDYLGLSIAERKRGDGKVVRHEEIVSVLRALERLGGGSVVGT